MMIPLLASLDDINEFLPQDVLVAKDGDDTLNRFQIDVDRTIKGYLASVFTLPTLQLWDEPANTPAFVRGIAGRLIAAYFYSVRTSESIPDWDKTYPQRIYNEAMQMLADIRSGLVVLTDVEETSGTLIADYYSPTKVPHFTTDMQF